MYADQHCVNESSGEAQVDVARRTQRNGGSIHVQCAFLQLNTKVLQEEYRMKSVAKHFKNEYRAVFSVMKDHTNLSKKKI